MIPVEHNLHCYKGQTFTQGIRFKANGEPIPLDGITAKAQIRPAENDPCLTAEFAVTVYAEEGRVILGLSPEETAELTPGVRLWDMKMTDGSGDVAYYVYGKFIIKGRVTE